RAINTFQATSPWSLVRNFSVDTTAPAAAKLTAPKDWSAATSGRPTFSWTAPVGGKTYVLQILSAPMCITPIFTSPALTSVSYTLPLASALTPGNYCWNVQAKDALG